jgi:hypothetical protein
MQRDIFECHEIGYPAQTDCLLHAVRASRFPSQPFPASPRLPEPGSNSLCHIPGQ